MQVPKYFVKTLWYKVIRKNILCKLGSPKYHREVLCASVQAPSSKYWEVLCASFVVLQRTRRKFRSQTSDNMDRRKAEMERVREEKRRRKRKIQKKEVPGVRKSRKVATRSVFSMICGSRGSKSRLAKGAGAEPAGQMRDEKLHAVVARSTFRYQNVQNTSAPEHS